MTQAWSSVSQLNGGSNFIPWDLVKIKAGKAAQVGAQQWEGSGAWVQEAQGSGKGAAGGEWTLPLPSVLGGDS